MSRVEEIDKLAEICNDIARSKGFWDGMLDPSNPAHIPIKLMLIVSEVAEAMEVDRELTITTDNIQQRDQEILEELADTVIRTLDLAWVVSGYGAKESFGKIMIDKIEKNRSRPVKHGKSY